MPHFEPRKQPRQARSSDTVEVILEAAARILEAEGLASVTTNRVAEKAGVSVGSLYQYFPNKQSILAEMVRRERRTLLADVTALCSANDGLQLEEFVRRLVKIGMKHQFGRLRLASELEHVEAVLPLHEGTADLQSPVIAKIGEALKHIDPQTECPNLLVNEVILPMVDTDMTAGRGQGKITPDAAAAAIINGLRKDRTETWVGKTRALRIVNRISPEIAARLLR